MLRRFLRDSAVYGLSTILVRGVSIFLVPVYTRILRPEDYGAVDIMMVFVAVVAVTVPLEISQALARLLPDGDTDDARSRLASTALFFTLATYTGFVGMGALFAAQLAALLLDDPTATDIIHVALAVAWTSGIFYLLQNQLRFSLKPAQYAASGVVYSLVGIAVSVLLVVGLRLGVLGVLLGQVAGGVAGIGIAGLFTRSAYRIVFDGRVLREMLAFSLPLVPSSVGVIVTLYVDRAAVKELLGLADLGLYGIGYRLSSLVTLLMVGFSGALVPLIYAHYREPGTPRELSRIFRIFTALAGIVTVGLSLFATEILMVATTPAYYAGATVVPLLAPALLLSSMYIFAPGLAIARRTGMTSVINIVGGVLNAVLNVVLIPPLGISGAALATLLSAAAIFGAYMVFSQRHYPVPHAWSILTVMVVIVGAAVILGTALPAGLGAPLVAKALLFLAAGAVLVVLAFRRSRAEVEGPPGLEGAR